MTSTTATIRDLRNGNSTVVLTEQAEGNDHVAAKNARTLLRLRTLNQRSAARQERTYRLNTEPGWRPSDLLTNIVSDLLARPDGSGLRSDVARSILTGE